MKTPEEQRLEAWRIDQIRQIEEVLPPDEQNDAIIAVNLHVYKWKLKHPELFKDEGGF